MRDSDRQEQLVPRDYDHLIEILNRQNQDQIALRVENERLRAELIAARYYIVTLDMAGRSAAREPD